MASEIELVQMRRFAAVVEHGSFAEAARRLNMTQQALSASIARLEESAGVRFLERRRGSAVQLTSYGRVLLDRARNQLALADQLSVEIGRMRGFRQGRVSVGIGETMMGRRVSAAIGRFHQSHPQAQLHLVDGYTSLLVPLLIRGELDMVLGRTDANFTDADAVECQSLFEVRHVLAVRRGHPLDGRPDIGLEELAKYGWIVPAFHSELLRVVSATYREAGLNPPERMVHSDAPIIGTSLWLDGDFIIMVSRDVIERLIDSGEASVLDAPAPSLARTAGIITLRRGELGAAAEHLLREVRQEFEARSITPLGNKKNL